MSKLQSQELLENGQGKYMAQVVLTHDDVKILLHLIEVELMTQRKHGKDKTYQQVQVLKRTLFDSSHLLKYAFQARQEGRFRAMDKDHGYIKTNKDE